MTCVHLRKLYQLCQQNDIRLGADDLVRIVCRQCGVQDVCPSTLRSDDGSETDDRQTELAAQPAPLIMGSAKVSIPAA